MRAGQVDESIYNQVAPFISALFGIPAAGFGVLVFSLQIPRLLYGGTDLLPLTAEIGSLIVALGLLFLLRACLRLPSAPHGLYRDVLDFLAMSRWHASVTVALAGLLALTTAWSLHSAHSLFFLWRILGWRALKSGDFRDDLDRLVVPFQLALTGGVPLLFCLHMLTRWKPQKRVLPWVLVPVLFVGAAIATVFIVAMVHQ